MANAALTAWCSATAVAGIGAGQHDVADQVRAEIHGEMRLEAEDAALATPREADLRVLG